MQANAARDVSNAPADLLPVATNIADIPSPAESSAHLVASTSPVQVLVASPHRHAAGSDEKGELAEAGVHGLQDACSGASHYAQIATALSQQGGTAAREAFESSQQSAATTDPASLAALCRTTERGMAASSMADNDPSTPATQVNDALTAASPLDHPIGSPSKRLPAADLAVAGQDSSTGLSSPKKAARHGSKTAAPESHSIKAVHSRACLKVMPCLKALTLACSQAVPESKRGNIPGAALRLLGHLPSLTHLALDGRPVDFATVQHLSSSLTRLADLSLSHCLTTRCAPCKYKLRMLR